jgi:hypothetical protein
MRVDQELACDASVIARYPKARAPYAKALLKTELAARPLPLGCYWPARAVHPLTERMAMLRHDPLPRARRLVGAACVGVLAAAAGAAAWAARAPHVVLSTVTPSPTAASPGAAGARGPAQTERGPAWDPSVAQIHTPLAGALAAAEPQDSGEAGREATLAAPADVLGAPDTTQVARLETPAPDRTPAVTAPSTLTGAANVLSAVVVEARKRVTPSTADLPAWSQTPTAAEMQAAYPPAAAKANYAASGTLECSVDPEGALVDCVVSSESAPGFGAAALSVAPKFRLPTTAPSGASMVGRTVRPRFSWMNPSSIRNG